MLAFTPPMGWNSWNSFGEAITADLIIETTDAFIETGLAGHGYDYIVIDDFWEADRRVDGRLTWDETKFPDGIKPLADYIHSKGLKFGIYSCAGSHTCGGKPASYGYEEIDAQTFAAWGVDFLKYDFCHVPPGVDAVALYKRMGQALRATGRPIVYSICEWGVGQPWKWASHVGGHLWRTTPDIRDNWSSIVENGFRKSGGLEGYAGPGGWNDPDMLVVGMYGQGNEDVAQGGCSDAEYRAHFSLWCLLAAPLMIGCDVRTMNEATQAILMNAEAVAVNQDELGAQGYCVGRAIHGGEIAEIWAKPLMNGDIAVGLFNMGSSDQRQIVLAWEALGLHPERPCEVYDLWAQTEPEVHTTHYSAYVNSHDVAFLRLHPVT